MTEREEFEAWMRTGELDLTPDLERYGDVYEDWDTQRAWRGWQAARATAEQRNSVIEECARICETLYYQPSRESLLSAAGRIRALKSQQDAAIESKLAEQPDSIRALIAVHAEQLDQNDYAYFELAYTRHTAWMAWLCSNSRDDDPNRKVLAKGQGHTPEEACAAAIESQRSGNV